MYDVSEYKKINPEKMKNIPFISLIGGVASTGKSTIALEIANRLHIDRVVHTDIITEIMHAYENLESNPLLFEHTYESWRHFGEKTPENIIKGYLVRSKLMHPMITRIINRSINKGRSLVMEGVHITPDLAVLLKGLASVFILTIKDDETHRMRIEEKNLGRTVLNTKLYECFDAIRLCNDYFKKEAPKQGVIVIENNSIEETIAKIMEMKYQFENRKH